MEAYMNIYVASFKPMELDYYSYIGDEYKNTSFNLDSIPESDHIVSWWYELRKKNGDLYFRLNQKIKNYTIPAGTTVFLHNYVSSYEETKIKVPIGYVIISKKLYFDFKPGLNVDQYDEEFQDGTWYKLGDWNIDNVRYSTLDDMKKILCYDELRFPIVGDETEPYYNGLYIDLQSNDKHVYVSVDPTDRNASVAPYRFITEGVYSDYISFQWYDNLYEPGKFTLTLPATQEAIDLFLEDRYLLIGSSDRAMMIEKVVFNNNLKQDGYILQVTGRSLEAVLERRVAFPGQGLNTNEYKGESGMIKAIYDLVDHFFIHPEEIAVTSSDGNKYFYYPERKVPFITLPPEKERYYSSDNPKYIKRPFRSSVNKSVSKENLLVIINDLCKKEQLGFKIIPKQPYDFSLATVWEFSLYTGEDKSYERADKSKSLLLFSPVLKNVESVATTKDSTNYRNVIFCGVEKESDGYINLQANTSAALNYQTGIEIFDKINSGATSLITGVKDQLVTKLENSEISYTGVLFLAIAASFKDKAYQQTVLSIEEVGVQRTKIFVQVSSKSDDSYSNSDSVIKIKVRMLKSKSVIGDLIDRLFKVDSYKDDYLSFVLTGEPVEFEDNGEKTYWRELTLLPTLGEKPDILGIYGQRWNPNTGEEGAWEDVPLFIADEGKLDDSSLNVTYRSENDVSFGEMWANGIGHTVSSDVVLPLRDYLGKEVEGDNYGHDTLNFRFVEYDGVNGDPIPIVSYPSDYISFNRAKNIKITFRHNYAEKEGVKLKETGMFMLSDVSKLVEVPGMDKAEYQTFKTSTGFGWFTLPILKQANADLNNTTFSKLSMLKKSAIQAWFKTFDKYTSENTQLRWLCQEYKNNSDSVGINRREVFVDQSNDENQEWNASAINQWKSNTKMIQTNEEDDEETDEEINERLMETARKRSGDYIRNRKVDASFDTTNYEYLSDKPNGYNLGDIIQIDDGWDNLERCCINGIVLSVDTSSGFKIVPSFEKYEPIPKEFKKLDYLQVANMILPAKFNRPFNVATEATELNLPSNVYFSGEDDEEQEKVGAIDTIYREVTGVTTDIECELQYVQKTVISGEEPEPLSSVFALISAIGSQTTETGYPDNKGLVSLPFALVSTRYSSPFYFMTNIGEEGLDTEDNRKLFYYMNNQIDLTFVEESGNKITVKNEYRSGVGLVGRYVDSNGAIQHDNMQDYIFMSNYDAKRHKYFINDIEYDYAKYTENDTHVNMDKKIYYASVKEDDTVISKRPLVRGWYLDGARFGDYLEANICFVDSMTNVEHDAHSVEVKGRSVTFDACLAQSIKPNYSGIEVKIDKNYWGQDNYRYSFAKNDLPHENNIVLGGAACYIFDHREKIQDYTLRFYNYGTVEQNNTMIDEREASDSEYRPLADSCPKACDTNNGVRIYGSIKIYETINTGRQIGLQKQKTIYNIPDDERTYSKVCCPSNDEINHYDGNEIPPKFGEEDILAFYPDLSTRKLVHEYVPVRYTEGGDDIEKEEEYGLYDTVEGLFIPINWGNNESATFIEAGGETKNE